MRIKNEFEDFASLVKNDQVRGKLTCQNCITRLGSGLLIVEGEKLRFHIKTSVPSMDFWREGISNGDFSVEHFTPLAVCLFAWLGSRLGEGDKNAELRSCRVCFLEKKGKSNLPKNKQRGYVRLLK